jgi:hypothetical protein
LGHYYRQIQRRNFEERIELPALISEAVKHGPENGSPDENAEAERAESVNHGRPLPL